MCQNKYGKVLFLPISITLTLLMFFTISLNAQNNGLYTMSGNVTASENGTPLISTILIYTEMMQNGSVYLPMEKTVTDENGNYSIQLKTGYNYKVQACPMDNNYMSKFYNNSDNIEDAVIFDMNQDFTDINFNLNKKPIYDNGIHGVVKNINGSVVLAKITLFSVEKKGMSYSTSSDQNNGSFNFTNIVAGQYYIYAIPQVYGFSDGYFKENDFAVKDINLASIITINESGINSEDYLVLLSETEVKEKFYGVTGYVFDDSYQFLENVNIEIFDESGNQVKTKEPISTDSKGQFNIELTERGKYMLFASKDGYEKGNFSFYLDESMPNQYIKLMITKKEIINFNNGIKGLVQNANGELLFAQVTAYKVESDEKINARYQSIKTVYTSKESPGEFVFNNMPSGNYILFAALNNAASGYYKENEPVVVQMEEATIITVNETGINSDNYIIKLEKYPDLPIMFTAVGTVTDINNMPLADVSITVTDENGKNVFEKNIIAEIDGVFKFAVPAGIFEVVASKAGYIDKKTTLNTTNINTDYIKLSFVMDVLQIEESKLVSDVTDKNSDANLILVSPNPTKDNLNLNLTGFSGKIEINVIDMKGINVIVNSQNISNNSIYNLDVSNLTNGTYLIRIKNSNNEYKLSKFVKQ